MSLTTAEVARRLGIKPETVYAYVSRGLLTSRRNADGRGSLFDRAEVDALAATGRRGTTRTTLGGATEVTTIVDGRPRYRGHDACELARSAAYEEVVSLLWTGRLAPLDLAAPADRRALAEAVTAPLPGPTRLTDRLHVIVAAIAAADPLRFDTTPAAVVTTGRTLLATMVDALPERGRARRVGGRRPPASADGPSAGRAPAGGALAGGALAERLWRRLSPAPPDPAGVAALNAALVLLADHDLAASTIAARVAASTRAHPYAVVSAGLAALDGPLHGAASGLAYRFLADAVAADDPITVLSEQLRTGAAVAGFGHRLYPDGDPRATALLAALTPIAADEVRRSRITTVAEAMRGRSGVAPDIDFALAALALLTGMGAEAGEVIFAVARTAGWLAHAQEEYANRPNRFRPWPAPTDAAG